MEHFMHIALLAARHSQTVVSVRSTLHSDLCHSAPWGIIDTHTKRAENKWKTKTPDVGLPSTGKREKGSRKLDVLGRWIYCLGGGDAPAGMPMGILERVKGSSGFPSPAGCKSYRCYLQMQLASRKEGNTDPSSRRAASH